MIFNPLFFSESGNTTAIVNKPNKLSNNKYLFSDIVKVVMNPEREQKKLLEKNIDNIFNPELKIVPSVEQNPEQLKLKFLDDQETKKAKLELADILPEDIAQLLINEETIIDRDKALSYVSKEPLNSDLQIFLNGLVGEKLIKNYISKDTGIFLSLEDSKSAVNIELTKELSNQKTQGKIIVQTLVIPEKSKLISLLNNTEENSLLLSDKLSKNTLQEVSQTNLKSNSETDNIVTKPTLSVYSFKNSNDYSGLTKGLAEITEKNSSIKILEHINNANSEKHISAKNSLLKKISFVPRDYKDKNGEAKKLEYIKSNKQLEVDKNSKAVLSNKNYNISKITILKKQDKVIGTYSKKVNSKHIGSTLRKIEFVENTNNKKSDLHLILKQSSTTKKNSQALPNSNTASTKDVEIKLKGEHTKSENLDNKNIKNLINNADSKKTELNKNDIDNNSLKSKKMDKNVFAESSNSKVTDVEQSKSDIKVLGSNVKSKYIEKNAVQNESSQLSSKEKVGKTTQANTAKNNLKETKVDDNVKVKSTENELKSNTKTKRIINSDKSKPIKSEKTSITNKISTESKPTDKELVSNVSDKKEKVRTLKSEQTGAQKVSNKSQIKVMYEKLNEKSNTGIKQEDTGTSKVEYNSTENKTIKTSSEIGKETVSVTKSELKDVMSLDKSEKIVKEEKAKNNVQNKDKTVFENKKIIDNSHQTQENRLKTENHKEINLHKDDNEESNKTSKNENNISNKVTGNLTEAKLPAQSVNKKISVKVKGGVKKISENNNSSSESVSVKNSSDQPSGSNNGTESNLSENNKDILNTKEHMNIKLGNEHNFNNVLHKEGVKINETPAATTFSDNSTANKRVIKSIEVIKEISRFIARKESGTFSFKIEPEHLGKMKITLDTIDNLLKATIEVDNEQSKQMIERNINKLHSQLSESGIELNSLNISLRDSKNQRNDEEISNNKTKQSKNNSRVGETEEKPKQKKSLGYNTYEFIA